MVARIGTGLRTLVGGAMAAAWVTAAAAASPPAPASGVDRVKQSKTLRIAYREDAPPFSFANSKNEPSGFIVDLCRAVGKHLAEQLAVPDLKLAYVKVTAQNRFDAIEKGQADLLCEPTSATLGRREHVDFSIATFVDGASLMVRGGGPRELQGLAGMKVGVLGGTTTETALRNSLNAAGVKAEVVLVKNHDDGLSMLDTGAIAAYFADRAILIYLANGSSDPSKLAIANNYLTLEPYALALAHGDEAFRLEVDRALSRIYRSGEIGPLFNNAFGGNLGANQMLSTLYGVSALPE
jgi:ABC-type amino acid transport substrate-binding protein